MAEAPSYVNDELLVKFKDSTARVDPSVGRVIATLPRIHMARVKLRKGLSVAQAAASVRKNGHVEFVEPNYIRRIDATPNDTQYAEQFSLTKTETDKAWDSWQPRGTAVIAILDTGVSTTHADLQNVILRNSSGVAMAKNTQTGASTAEDDHGHGTHCAGIAAAQINNATGVAGVAGWNPSVGNYGDWVRIMPVKVLDSTGEGSDANVIDGIVWAADNGANVISMSLGGAENSAAMNTAIQYAWNKGVVVVAAAGNHGTSNLYYPAACDNTISVASTNSTDTLSSWSGYGTWVDVAAPGEGILSTYPGGYGFASGTSMSTPFVAGEVALLKAHNPALTNVEITNLVSTNHDPYTPYSGRTIGGGRVNVKRALLAATPMTYTLIPSVTSVTAGAPLSVNWTAPSGRPPSDWVSIFKMGADNRQYGAWKYTGGAATGVFTLTAPAQAGDYEFRYLLNNGYTDVARSVKITVEAAAAQNYSVTASPGSVTEGGSINVTFAAPVGRPGNDWIGLFRVGDPNQAYGWWSYTGGATSGSFSVPAPSAGNYEFRYLLNNGYTDSARSNTVTVSAGSVVFVLTPSASAVTPGGALSISWIAPAARPANDWIGLFKIGDPYTSYIWWTYTNGQTSGTSELTAPLTAGTYEFRYFEGGSREKARSAPVTVSP